MSAKIVCADCHFVFDPADPAERTSCPQCGAAVHSFGPTIQPADPTPDDAPRRARPVARRVPKDDPDERPVRRSRRRREDEDDEDLDDRPRRRRPPATSPGSSVWIFVGIGAFFLLALGGLGFAAWSRLAGPEAGPAPVAMQPPPFVPNEMPAAVPAPPPKPAPGMEKKQDGAQWAEQQRELMRQQGMMKGPIPVQPPPPVFNPPPIGPAPVPKPPAVPLKFPAVNALPVAAEHDVKERRTLSLPGEVTAVCIGGGGRFVCLHFDKLRQIGIFDANTAKVAKYLPVPGESIAMAAGMECLIVYDRNADIFVRWNLRTFAKEATLPNPTNKPVGRMLLGSASAGPLVLAPKTDPNGWGGGEAAYVDPISFKLFDVENPLKNTGRAPNWNAANISDDGKLIVGPTGWGSGEFIFFRLGNPPDAKTVPGINAASARPSSDGRYVYSASATHTAGGAPVDAGNPVAAAVAVPSLQGNMVFRAFNRTDVPGGAFPFRDRDADADLDFKFYMEGQATPFVTWTKRVAPVAAMQYRPPGTAFVDQRFYFVPDAKLLAVLSSSNDRLFLHRFDGEEELEKSGVDYLMVASRPPVALFGKPYSYPIRVKSRKGGVKYKLESGPDGMKVAADGRLTWAVPQDAEPASVLLTISDASGQEIFHNFTLEPQKDEPAATAVEIPPDVAVKVRPPVIPNPVPVPRLPSIFEAPAKAFPLTPTKAEDGAEVKLPGEVDAVCAAGGGRFLILRIPTAKQLAVLDLCEGKVAKYLPLAEEKPLIAAGMNKLFVLNPSANVIQRWDLTTFEKELSVANPVDGGTPQTLAMGHASDGPLLVVTGDGRGWGGKHAFLNAKTLRPFDLKAAATVGHGALLRLSEGPVRVSPDGRVYGFWRVNSSPTGLDCLVLADDGGSTVYHEHTSVGAILPGPDGTLHTGSGLFSPQLKPLDRGTATTQRPFGSIRVPAAHGPFYLEISNDRRTGVASKARPPKGATGGTEPKEAAADIFVKMIGELSPVATLEKVAGFGASKNPADNFGRTVGLQIYDRFHYVPAANVLAVIDAAKSSVFFTRLNVKEKLAASGTDYLLALGKPPAAVRGAKFAYLPEVWSKAGGVKFKLDAGPDGMTADAKGVAWDVPKDYPGGAVDVILTVSNAAGKETFHTFKLSVIEGK